MQQQRKLNLSEQKSFNSAIAPGLQAWIAERMPVWQKLIDPELNRPWFTERYGGESTGGCSVGEGHLKKPWQKHNTRKLDAIREEIDRFSLSDVEEAVLLTSLILVRPPSGAFGSAPYKSAAGM